MTLNEYQVRARSTAVYKQPVMYPILGLAGEAGELCNKYKKRLRDGDVSDDALLDELGDVLWYVANVAADLGASLDEVARRNIEKLESRKLRGTIHGSGDSR